MSYYTAKVQLTQEVDTPKGVKEKRVTEMYLVEVMSYRISQPVIVTQEGVNKVGIIVEKFLVNKSVMYDVLLESRSAISAINTAKSKQSYINKDLTEKLCETGMIVPTMDYDSLFENNLIPQTRS